MIAMVSLMFVSPATTLATGSNKSIACGRPASLPGHELPEMP